MVSMMNLSRMTSAKVGLSKTARSGRFFRVNSQSVRLQRIRNRTLQQQHRHNSGGGHQHHQQDPFVRPYSDSLPAEGYEWCTRCNIRCHKLQKKVGEHNGCLDSPRLFGLGICNAAKNYWKRRVYTMIALGCICFMPLPSGSMDDSKSQISKELVQSRSTPVAAQACARLVE